MSQEQVPLLSSFDEAALEQAFSGLAGQAAESARSLASPDAVEQFRLEWLGRKQGRLKLVSEAWLKSAPPEAKKLIGQRFNKLKEQVEELLANAGNAGPDDAALDREAIDVTLPGTRTLLGAEHPIVRTMNEIVSVFQGMGYSVGVGPEVETDYYNFESLNFPPNHPARDTQDTLVVANQERRPLRDRLLMRTHTSPVQIRTMEQQPPPVRIVIPGKVHRNDASDATHSPIFHQVEGLCVGENVTFSDLKGTLDHAMKAFFGLDGEDAILSVVLPVHGAERGRADQLHLLRRQGLPEVQALRLDRAAGLRHGGSRCLWIRAAEAAGLRSRKDQRLCLRHGRGTHRDDEVWHQRHWAVLFRGYEVSQAVCLRKCRKLAS